MIRTKVDLMKEMILEAKHYSTNKPKIRRYICNDESHLANKRRGKPKCFNCQ